MPRVQSNTFILYAARWIASRSLGAHSREPSAPNDNSEAAAPSIESDLFNPSIPKVRRTKDGGFDAVVPRGSIVADSLTGDGSDAKSPRAKDVLLHTTNGKGWTK